MKMWMQMVVAVLSVAGLASADTWPLNASDWSAVGTASSNWSAKWAWTGQTSSYQNAAWDASHNDWDASWNANKSGTDGVFQDKVLMWHPDTYGIIAWTAPTAGTYTLTTSAGISLGWWDTETRLINLSVQKNGTFLVADTLYNTTSTIQTVNLYSGDLTLNQGDVLYFRMKQASGGSSVYEAAAWNISIVPTPEPATMALLAMGGVAAMRRKLA